jgi:serine/threonine-protein kinase
MTLVPNPRSTTLSFDQNAETPADAGLPPLDPSVSINEFTSFLHRTRSSGATASAYIPPQPIEELCWNARYRVRKLLGSGAQGAVYLARRQGADGFFTDVALKIFYRHPMLPLEDYEREMQRIAGQGQQVSRIQHDNLISIRDFVSIGETRVMVLEWIDGLDLSQLLKLETLETLERVLSKPEWERLNDVVVTAGRDHCRVKAGIAVDILRGCLAGLAALHHNDIAHCDLKPSNIMLKVSGTKKIIDIDSSCVVHETPTLMRGTPYYMAPEQLQKRTIELRSDIASLGYILIEMLTGQRLFGDMKSYQQILDAKLRLPQRLDEILPAEVRNDRILSGMVRKMVAVNPGDRFPDADAADLDRVGAARFHRHLVQANLSTDYVREIAWWLEGLVTRGEVRAPGGDQS